MPFPSETTSGRKFLQPDAPVSVATEDERLAVLEHQRVVGLGGLVGDVAEGAVVEDVAVLEDLDEGRPFVGVCALDDLLQVLGLDVDAAGDEAGLGAERQRDRIERMVDRALRRRLGHLADLRRG